MKCIILSVSLLAAGLSHAQQSAVLKLINKASPSNQLKYIPSMTTLQKDSLANSVVTTTAAFYLTEYEVSNDEYREFTNYVRDSIAHSLLDHFVPGTQIINWKRSISWEDKRLEVMKVDVEWARPTIDPAKLLYQWGDSAIPVYPDTLVWLADFAYSYNEPLVKKYFRHKEFSRYPVVGVSYLQAMAFCDWKTRQLSRLLQDNGYGHLKMQASLPESAEWEAAASSGEKTFLRLLFKNGNYNINTGQIIDHEGVLLKDYQDDGYYYTAPVHSYMANSFGIYNLTGNVAEWIIPHKKTVYQVHDSVAIAKGGGWNSPPSQLDQLSKMQFHPDAAHSFVGFRYAVHISGQR